jgi:hypothetical protein
MSSQYPEARSLRFQLLEPAWRFLARLVLFLLFFVMAYSAVYGFISYFLSFRYAAGIGFSHPVVSIMSLLSVSVFGLVLLPAYVCLQNKRHRFMCVGAFCLLIIPPTFLRHFSLATLATYLTAFYAILIATLSEKVVPYPPARVDVIRTTLRMDNLAVKFKQIITVFFLAIAIVIFVFWIYLSQRFGFSFFSLGGWITREFWFDTLNLRDFYARQLIFTLTMLFVAAVISTNIEYLLSVVVLLYLPYVGFPFLKTLDNLPYWVGVLAPSVLLALVPALAVYARRQSIIDSPV